MKLPIGNGYQLISSNDVGSDVYAKYFTYLNPSVERNVVIGDNYVIDIDSDNISIVETRNDSNTITIQSVVINSDATIYVYGSEGDYYGSDYISVFYQEEKGRVVICSNY